MLQPSSHYHKEDSGGVQFLNVNSGHGSLLRDLSSCMWSEGKNPGELLEGERAMHAMRDSHLSGLS